MNRIIKFRFWEKPFKNDNGKFEGKMWNYEYVRNELSKLLQSEDYISMQFTGLKAMGEDVYEGDIVEEKDFMRIFKIEWNESEARFELVFVKGENGYEGQRRHIIDVFKMKKIGNIYETR